MKKLLVLGTSVGSVDIVKYARSKGVYTIVADYLPVGQSAAKRVADESVMISTGDVEKLIAYARENGVSAVFAGVSEFNIESARKVNEALGVPFYYTPEQWQKFMNKGQFRLLCEQFGVSTPKTYFNGTREGFAQIDASAISYPVIVKPVDNGANVGITICWKQDELPEAAQTAFGSSNSGKIIVEQYIKGPEISVTYVVQNGQCKLACMGTKYAYENEKGLHALAHGYVYPSPCLDEYLAKMDAAVTSMILESGINNATIFFQGIYREHEFYIFEAGLRLEGTATFRITESMHGQSFMKFLVDSLLGEETDYDVNREDATFGGKKCFIFSLIAKGGTIARIEGTERVSEDPSIIAFEQRHYVGDTILDDGTLRQITFRFVVRNDNTQKVADTINWIKDTVRAYDAEGQNLLIQTFDPVVVTE